MVVCFESLHLQLTIQRKQVEALLPIIPAVG